MSHHSIIGLCCVPTVCVSTCADRQAQTDRQTDRLSTPVREDMTVSSRSRVLIKVSKKYARRQDKANTRMSVGSAQGTEWDAGHCRPQSSPTSVPWILGWAIHTVLFQDTIEAKASKVSQTLGRYSRSIQLRVGVMLFCFQQTHKRAVQAFLTM